MQPSVTVVVELDAQSTDEYQVALVLTAHATGLDLLPHRLVGFAGPRFGPASIWVRSHRPDEDPSCHTASLDDVMDVVQEALVDNPRSARIWAGLVTAWSLVASASEVAARFDPRRDVIISQAVTDSLLCLGSGVPADRPVVSRIETSSPKHPGDAPPRDGAELR
jgi:hypothetical protein